MVMFNSYVSLPEGNPQQLDATTIVNGSLWDF